MSQERSLVKRGSRKPSQNFRFGDGHAAVIHQNPTMPAFLEQHLEALHNGSEILSDEVSHGKSVTTYMQYLLDCIELRPHRIQIFAIV